MSRVALLADNDVLLSAAHWGLLDQVPTIASATWANVAALSSLPPRVKKSDPKLFQDPAVAAAMVPFLSQCAPLPNPDSEVIAILQGRHDIDVGEQLLLAAACNVPHAFVLTGDKRAIRALATLRAEGLLPQLSGRLLCLEQWIWHVLSALGPGELVERFRRCPDRNQAVRAVLGRVGQKSAEEIREGLASYISELDDDAPDLLVKEFGIAK